MARPANANAHATRTRIIKAASTLFAEKGRDGTSVREIASEAHVNGAMISHYFGGKDGLYRDCIQSLYGELAEGQAAFETALSQGNSLDEIIANTMSAALRFARERRGLIRLIMRHVLDRGELDPKRREAVLLPFLDKASQSLALISRKPAVELRLGLQSLIFLTVRYALCTDDELRQITGHNTDAQTHITHHLIASSISMLGLQGGTS